MYADNHKISPMLSERFRLVQEVAGRQRLSCIYVENDSMFTCDLFYCKISTYVNLVFAFHKEI